MQNSFNNYGVFGQRSITRGVGLSNFKTLPGGGIGVTPTPSQTCNCNTDDDWCMPGWSCQYSEEGQSSWGCGWGWLSPCNGVCTRNATSNI